MRSPAVRLSGVAISAMLAVGFGWWALVSGIASLGPDGTWTDTLGFLAFTALALGCGALALGGTR